MKQTSPRQHYLLAVVSAVYAFIFYASHITDGLRITTFLANLFAFTIFGLVITKILLVVTKKTAHRDKIVHGLLVMLIAYYLRSPINGVGNVVYYIFFDTFPESVLMDGFILGLKITCYAIFFFLGWITCNFSLRVSILIMFLTLYPLYNLSVITYKNLTAVEIKTVFHGAKLPPKTFKYKPNVYFFLFDGYASIDSLKLLNLTAHDPSQILTARGFKVYPSFFTNLQSTRNAMPTYFNFSLGIKAKSFYRLHHKYKNRIIAGDNPVFKMFSDNDYTTNLITEHNFPAYGQCFANRCSNRVIQVKRHLEPLQALQVFDKVITFKALGAVQNWARKYRFTFTEEVGGETIDLPALVEERQNFTYMHIFSPNHAPVGDGVCDERKEKKEYAERLVEANAAMTEMIDTIVARDPDALIIVASDHGAYLFNHCSYYAPLLTKEEVIERQGALLAIRWGDRYDGRFDAEIKSSVNLFYFIFSYLADDTELLKLKTPDDAFYLDDKEIVQSISDGKILLPPATPIDELPR